jgi:hypothetical protein
MIKVTRAYQQREELLQVKRLGHHKLSAALGTENTYWKKRIQFDIEVKEQFLPTLGPLVCKHQKHEHLRYVIYLLAGHAVCSH